MIRFILPIFFFLPLVFQPEARAQGTGLQGTWKVSPGPGDGTGIILELNADATVRFSINGTTETIGVPAIPGEEDPLTEIAQVGTWETSGDSLFLHISHTEVRVNRMPIEDYLIEYAKTIARQIADAQGVSDEDYSALEQEAIDEILSGWRDNFGEQGEDEAVFIYALGNDRLTLISENMTVEMVRSAPTNTAPSSWGELKARF